MRARTRGWRKLGTGMGGWRSKDGKNRALIRGRGYLVHPEDRGYLALVNLIGAEGQ